MNGIYTATNLYPDAKSPTAFQDGLEFQDFIMEDLAKRGVVLQNYASKKYQFEKGENIQGWEIKLDNRCTETGRLSIEISEKSKASNTIWVPSGIYRGDSWLYIQGNYQEYYVFFTKILRALHSAKNLCLKEHELPTIKKFYLPLDLAERYGYRIECERREL